MFCVQSEPIDYLIELLICMQVVLWGNQNAI